MRISRTQTGRRTAHVVIGVCTLIAAAKVALAQRPDFTRDIQPILAGHCYQCHSQQSMGGIRLDVKAGAFGKGGSGKPTIVPGHSDASELIRRVSSQDKTVRMPFGGQPLAAADIALLRAWIDAGADWPDGAPAAPAAAAREMKVSDKDRRHWAFQPLRVVSPPMVKDAGWARTAVDRFILATLQNKGLTPAPEASRAQLIRRVSFDLVGLPPAPQEIDAFVHDSSPKAYEALVERLLASPHFGEQWGRHWLDVARYADSEGYHEDLDRPDIYHYRDWVIRALNSDMPFDQFVRWQLAGDEYASGNPDAMIATGFLAAGPRVYIEASDSAENKEQYRYDELDDFVTTTGAAMLGLTVGCARCHDHKFDPIPTRDYYRLAAVFGNFERTDAFLSQPHRDLERFLAAKRAALREEKMNAAAIPEDVRPMLRVPLDKDNSGQRVAYEKYDALLRYTDEEFHAWLTDADKETLARLRRQVAEAGKTAGADPPRSVVIVDSQPQPKETYLLARGSIRNKKEAVPFGFLSVLTSSRQPEDYRLALRRSDTTSYQRSALAEWLVDVDHGAGALLARVIVNRLWQHHFGEGLVATPNDFGLQGDAPSNPELLDWLANELIRGGWRLKPIHRLILLSAAYRQSATANPAGEQTDPEDRLLWRRRPLRLQAENLRDSILDVSGSLNLQMFGPAVRPYIPPEVITSRSRNRWPKDAADSPETWRRSIYVFSKRSIRLPMLETFDAPDGNTSCPRRVPTTVPTQALALMNDNFVRQQAGRFAARVEADAPGGVEDQVSRAYLLALGRLPRATEMEAARHFLAAKGSDGATASLTDFCQVLFTLNEFLYVD